MHKAGTPRVGFLVPLGTSATARTAARTRRVCMTPEREPLVRQRPQIRKCMSAHHSHYTIRVAPDRRSCLVPASPAEPQLPAGPGYCRLPRDHEPRDDVGPTWVSARATLDSFVAELASDDVGVRYAAPIRTS